MSITTPQYGINNCIRRYGKLICTYNLYAFLLRCDVEMEKHRWFLENIDECDFLKTLMTSMLASMFLHL